MWKTVTRWPHIGWLLLASACATPAPPARPVVTVAPEPRAPTPEPDDDPPPPPRPASDAAARCREAPDPTDAEHAPRPLTELESQQLELVGPGRGCATPDPVVCQYVAARIVFEARQWREAASRFREIALEHPEHPTAIYALELALQAQHALGEPCRALMRDDAAKYLQLYCTNDGRPNHEELCQRLEQQVARDR
jgi:hypothetical protein